MGPCHTDGACCGPGSYCCVHTGPHEHAETVRQIRQRAAQAARERHDEVLPDGYTVKWRAYGRGGRWRGVAPNTWVETADRDVVEWEMWWWQVAADENDAEFVAATHEGPTP